MAKKKKTYEEAVKRIDEITDLLENGGVSATVRREMGADISAACGQLRAAAEGIQ